MPGRCENTPWLGQHLTGGIDVPDLNDWLPLGERFWMKVQKAGPDECWLWKAGRVRDGYGVIKNKHGGVAMAHRVSYASHVGPIPEGLHIHHKCHTKHCVNPAHLEAVTARENRLATTRLQTHCKRGHEFNETNTYVSRKGARFCRLCRLERDKLKWAKPRPVDLVLARTITDLEMAIAHYC